MTLNIITAFCASNFGIGKDGKLPWDLPEDLAHFGKITKNSVVIMGRKTWESIPVDKRPLKNRINIVVTKDVAGFPTQEGVIPVTLDESLNVAYQMLVKHDDKDNIFVIGGQSIYEHFMRQADNIFVTLVYKNVECDTFFPTKNLQNYAIAEYSDMMHSPTADCKYRFIKYTKCSAFHQEYLYTHMANNILYSGKDLRQDRTGTGTYSKFGGQLCFDISDSIPVLTTKQVAFRTVVKELLFFLRGDTNTKLLEQEGVNIWKGNTTREFLDGRNLEHYQEGDMGPMYGYNWRNFGGKYEGCHVPTSFAGGYDQLDNLIEGIKNDPYSRRHMMTTFNPADVARSVLAPCHGIVTQFYVTSDTKLSCHVYCRSSDVFLGLPFNIASYAVLTYIIAKKTGLQPSELVMSFGDVHIYANHVQQIEQQLCRDPLPFPCLKVSDAVKDKDWKDIIADDIELIGYIHHPSIRAPMAV